MEQHRSGGALEEADLPTSLSGPQILAIMDQLTVMEATWHAGNPLAQTVYTSHYILRQERCDSAAQGTPNKACTQLVQLCTESQQIRTVLVEVCEVRQIITKPDIARDALTEVDTGSAMLCLVQAAFVQDQSLGVSVGILHCSEGGSADCERPGHHCRCVRCKCLSGPCPITMQKAAEHVSHQARSFKITNQRHHMHATHRTANVIPNSRGRM